MAILTVTSLNDSGTGSLRDTIASASNNDTINFSSSLANQVITFTSLIAITENLVIDGIDAVNLALSGNNTTQLFRVNNHSKLTLKNLIVKNAKTTNKGGAIQTSDYGSFDAFNCKFNNNDGGIGGAVYIGYAGISNFSDCDFNTNLGTSANSGFSGGAVSGAGANNLFFSNCNFTNNNGTTGGAIYCISGKTIVQGCKFITNKSTGDLGGGAIVLDGYTAAGNGKTLLGGFVLIQNSLFDSNSCIGLGGALLLYGYNNDKAIVSDCIFQNNKAESQSSPTRVNSKGGAIYANANLDVINSAFVANNSNRQGGAFFLIGGGAMNFINCTVHANTTTIDAGGAFFIDTAATAPLNLINCTITNNVAATQGGAFQYGGSKDVTLTNCIISNNTASIRSYPQTIFTSKSGGGNIEYPAPPSGGKRVVSDSLIADPLLDSIQTVNGTLLRPLLTNSPAINLGITGTEIPTADQSRVARVSLPDAGAYEKVTTRTQRPLPTYQDPNNWVYGTGGNDTLVGASNTPNIILGGYGNDVLIAGNTTNILVGSGGTDRFKFNNFYENGSWVLGFDPKREKIDLSNLIAGNNYSNPEKFATYVKIVASGSNSLVQINPDGDTTPGVFKTLLTLKSVSSTSITATNFIF
ncbi:choice-of-anchor Q domain-containing protein [Halotia wernerae UHCC 0503]|nr:choice-of-anchor Q domain-containing protein [Halotia wernerae UHCC 0503]